MKALTIQEFGKLESVCLSEAPSPSIGPLEILVGVKATGLNRADVLQCLGKYPAPKGFSPDIPGLEYAGVVEETGAQVTRFRAGDRVMGLVGGGAFAETLSVHENEAIRIPRGFSYTDAAALPEAFITAYDALFLQGGLSAGEWVLIHSVGSGVGTAAIQLAHAFGAFVIGTSRTESKLAKATSLGLKVPLLGPSFSQEVNRQTGGRGVDVALDLVGGPYLPETLRCMAHRGRILLIGLTAGVKAEIPLTEILTRRLTLRGSTLRSRSLDEKCALAREFEENLLPLFENGRLQPVVDSVFPVSEAVSALFKLSNHDTFGKVILEWKNS